MSSRTIQPAPSFVDTQTLSGRFVAQVQRTPHHVALTAPGVEFTYAELNARANQVAHRLLRAGVGPETLIGILVERTAETVIGILGILKAGCAYVPVDPAVPREKRAFVIQDSELKWFLTQGATSLGDEAAEHLSLDAWEQEFAPEPTDDPELVVEADQLAYVIYTSGSTGRPKGVQVEHRHVDRLFRATEAWFHFDERDVWSLFHSCAFDFSVWELWGPLLYGGRLVVVPREAVQSMDAFHQLLCDQQVTVLNQTPSAFWQLVRADQRKSNSCLGDSLRYVIFGGEALDVSRLQSWFDRYGEEHPQLINMYGITETTVHCTYRRVTRADLQRPGSPIGEPIPDLQLHLRDAEGRPVPPGEVGEIYVSGAGVTRGYLNRPELNAARFLQGAEGEGSVYRSGDLALRTSDGGMDFVGRADNQVKLRGFRIELGEIESQLSAAPGVNACAVALDERSAEGRKQLVAYVISEDPQTPPQAAALRAHLEVTLPKYMVPSLFVGVDEFPLTSNAKLDRSNLPDPAACDLLDAKDDNLVFPRSASEQLVAGAWARVLDQAPPPVTVDFFDFGGDSLSLMDLSAELERLFQRPFPIQELVQATTVEAQAAWLEQGPRKQPWTPLVPLKTTGQKSPFFCVHPGGGNALCYRAVAAAFPADRPFTAIQAHGVDGLQPQLETVEEMAAAYADAIREVQPQGPYHIGGWSFGGLVAFEMARLFRDAHEEVATLAIIDAGLQHSLAVVRTLFLHDEVPLFHMSSLDHQELISHFRAPSMEAQLVPPGASDERVGNILKVFVKNCEAVFGFRPHTYDGAATLILAEEELVRVRMRRTPLTEWTEYCRDGVEAIHVPGNHLTMINPPHAADLADAIASACDTGTAPQRS